MNLKASLIWGSDYKELTLFRQWEEPSSHCNPQTDITSEEHLQILLTFPNTNYIKIISWTHLRAYALYVQEEFDTIGVHTQQDCRNIRQSRTVLTQAEFTPHLSTTFILPGQRVGAVGCTMVHSYRVVTLQRSFWWTTLERRGWVVLSYYWYQV